MNIILHLRDLRHLKKEMKILKESPEFFSEDIKETKKIVGPDEREHYASLINLDNLESENNSVIIDNALDHKSNCGVSVNKTLLIR